MLDVTVLDDVELSTLIKAMHEARFAESPLDPIVWCNPFVIDLHVAALKEWTSRRDEQGETRPSDERFYQWRGRTEQLTILRRLDEDASLRRGVADRGVDEIRDLLRPFILDEASAADLLERARRTT